MRKITVRILKIAISIILIGFLLRRVGPDRVITQFYRADPFWLGCALLLFSISHIAGSFQWWVLLRAEKVNILWIRTLQYYFIGLFFNNFLISGMGGDLFRMMDVRRSTKNGAAAVSTVFLDRFMGFFVLSGLAVLASPWFLLQSGFHMKLGWILMLLLVCWILVLFLLFNKRFARPLAWLLKRWIPEKITAKVRTVYNQIHDFGRKKNLFLDIALLSLAIQSARIFTHYLIARALGVELPPHLFFLIIPLVAIVASLPISMGGVGLREQTGIILFGLVGLGDVEAFSVEFMAYLVAVVTSLPGGLLFVFQSYDMIRAGQSREKMNSKGGI